MCNQHGVAVARPYILLHRGAYCTYGRLPLPSFGTRVPKSTFQGCRQATVLRLLWMVCAMWNDGKRQDPGAHWGYIFEFEFEGGKAFVPLSQSLSFTALFSCNSSASRQGRRRPRSRSATEAVPLLVPRNAPSDDRHIPSYGESCWITVALQHHTI